MLDRCWAQFEVSTIEDSGGNIKDEEKIDGSGSISNWDVGRESLTAQTNRTSLLQ